MILSIVKFSVSLKKERLIVTVFTGVLLVLSVISTDTFFLHLSCIVNKETWGLIPFNADWRWYDYYKYNPYKSLKIYKQSENRNWDGVIDLIYSDIKNKFSI